MKRKYTSRQLGIMALFVSIGIILQYVENLIFISPVPGGKLGLCNAVTIINIFIFGSRNAIIISLMRAFLGTFITGGAMALPYSIAGTFFSVLAMCGVKKFFYPKVSMVGMSIVGAAMHNFAQVCVASIVMSSPYIFSYLSVLLVVSVFSGAVTGLAAQVFAQRILKIGDKNE